MTSPRLFFVRWRGQQMGPYPVEAIQKKLDSNEFGLMHEIQANNTWITLERFFQPAATSEKSPGSPQPLAAHLVNPAGRSLKNRAAPPPLRIPGHSSKNRLTYVLLAAFLGFTGIHNFYAGRWLHGGLQLILALTGFLAGYGILIPWLWAAGEMLFTRRDGQDRKFR